MVRGQLSGLRSRPEEAAGRRRRAAASSPLQTPDPRLALAQAREDLLAEALFLGAIADLAGHRLDDLTHVVGRAPRGRAGDMLAADHHGHRPEILRQLRLDHGLYPRELR